MANFVFQVDQVIRLARSRNNSDQDYKIIGMDDTYVTISTIDEYSYTYRADPDQVVMGDFVEIRDPAGKRIGHVSTASYHERLNGPAYVNVGIELR